MSSGKVSVVIPVYNVEMYLPQCLDSVLNQTYRNLEIICIDDCSPDHSSEILRNYAQRDNRVTVLRNECNVGLAATRNRGLEVATGEFIYFLDSDDWLEVTTIEHCVEAIDKTGAELVAFGINKFFESTNTLSPSHLPSNRFVTWHAPFLWGQYTKIGVTAWNKMYRLDFLKINKIHFPEKLLFEDNFFSWICFACCRKIALIPERLYYYRIRSNSIMTSSKNQDLSKCMDLLRGGQFYYNYLKTNKLWVQEERNFSASIDSILTSALHKKLKKSDQKSFCEAFKETASRWDWKPRRFTIAYDILYREKIAPFAFYRIVRSLRKRMGQL